MLLLLALACAPRATPVPPEPEVAVVEPTDVLVGVVHRNGTKTCREGEWDVTWHALYWEAGFTPLRVEDAAIEPFHGKGVVLRGRTTSERPKTAPIPEGFTTEGCPIPQLRSDMEETPDGIRLRRDGGVPFAAETQSFEVVEVAPFDGLKAERDGDEVVLTLTNTLGVALTEVEVRAHYEGCYGKPGTQLKTGAVPRLEPDASFVHRVPALVETEDEGPPRKGGNTRFYKLATVELRAGGDHVRFDYDAWLSDLGVDRVDCPKR